MLSPGQTIKLGRGRYRLTKQIAASSYGEVWEAKRLFRRSVALKFVRMDRMCEAPPASRALWRDSLRREVRFLRSLSPHETRYIVKLEDFGERQGMPVIAMERMACTLLDEINRRKQAGERISLALALDWLAQVNAALQVVHRHGWRYLDLKPTNILLAEDGKTLKAADFGANRPRAERGGDSFCGTLGWQAPEQFFPARRIERGYEYRFDHRADYFALGMLFYFIVTGGEVLRFSHKCKALFAREGEEGAYAARDEPATTFDSDERVAFSRNLFPSHVCTGDQSTWTPGVGYGAGSRRGNGSGERVLGLLESLLARDCTERPSTGLEIARRIHAVKTSSARQSDRVGGCRRTV